MRLKLPAALIAATALGAVWGVLPAVAQQAAPAATAQQAAGGSGMDGPEDAGPDGRPKGPRHQLTAEDRAAFLDARLAAVHAGLKLTPDQEKLWPAVENVVRDMRTAAEKLRASGEPVEKGDMIGRLKRIAERTKIRGEGLAKLAATAQPLWATLNEDQKWRLKVLMRSMHHRHMAMMERFRDAGRGMRSGPDDR